MLTRLGVDSQTVGTINQLQKCRTVEAAALDMVITWRNLNYKLYRYKVPKLIPPLINKIQLISSQTAKYLGLILDRKLSWNSPIEDTSAELCISYDLQTGALESNHILPLELYDRKVADQL